MLKFLVLVALLMAVSGQPVPGLGDNSDESTASDFFTKVKTGLSSGATKLKEGVEKGTKKVVAGAGKVYESVKQGANDGYQYVKEKIQGTTQSPLDKFVKNLDAVPNSNDNMKPADNYMYEIDVRSVPLAVPLAQSAA